MQPRIPTTADIPNLLGLPEAPFTNQRPGKRASPPGTAAKRKSKKAQRQNRKAGRSQTRRR